MDVPFREKTFLPVKRHIRQIRNISCSEVAKRMMKRLNKKKEKKEGDANNRRLLLVIAGSILLHTVCFLLLFFSLGYICYLKALDFPYLWLIYPAAAGFSSAVAALFAAGRLPLRGVLSGLAYALGFLVLHTLVLRLAGSMEGLQLAVTLLVILLFSLIGAVIGKNLRHRYR